MKLNAYQKAELLSFLLITKNPRKRMRYSGICMNVEHLIYLGSSQTDSLETRKYLEIKFFRYMRWMERKSRNWPKHSGNREYPVPSSSNKCSPITAYHYAASERTVWKGRYGRLRIQLLNFLIRELKKEIKK